MNIASRIPNEILSEIFLHTIDRPISNVKDNRFPWALHRVCKSWRSAFLTYPYLWVCITINLAESHSRGQDLNAVNQGFSLCLERSRNYPLKISLHVPAYAYYDRNTTLVWQTFLSCSHRWRTVYLANVIGKPQFVTLNSCTGKTPILESLTIHGPMSIVNKVTVFTGLQIAPHLTRVTLQDSAALSAVRKWSIPWMQLTNLMLRFEELSGVNQLRILFKQLRDIEELRLIFEDQPRISFFHTSGTTPQCLQHLRVLHVCCVEILSFITAPSLSELHLQGSFYPSTDDVEDVVAKEIVSSFIQRSSCKINKLSLSNFLRDLFPPLVELFPEVAELCIADAYALECLEHLLLPNQFPALHMLDCRAHTTNAQYFLETLFKILELRNFSSTGCLAVPLTKVISRSELEASVVVTTTDWASFESHVQIGTCCELNLTRQGPQTSLI